MNTWPRNLLIMIGVLMAFGVAAGASAQFAVDTDTGVVGLEVTDGSEGATPTPTVTATPTDEAKVTPTVPVVAQLPDTGNAPQGPAVTGVVLMMLTAGILLSLGGFAGSRRSR